MPLHLGQEAVAVGSAIQANDVLLPGYRDNAAPLWRGVTMENTLLFGAVTSAAATGRDRSKTFRFASRSDRRLRTAYAFKYRKQPRVAVCMLGDGSPKGDVWEDDEIRRCSEIARCVRSQQ